MRIRDADPEEAAEITGLVLRSKSHWGYPGSLLADWAPELTLTPERIIPRRVVVAEDDSGLLGTACLDGTPPEGAIGLLFVEPTALRRGIGRALYAHVLEAARERGFERVGIAADPHAVPFYRALGARPAPRESGADPAAEPGGLVPLVAELRPRVPWAQIWTGGRRAVHLGNAAEFQAQFGGATEQAREAASHYACLAVFASPHPAAVVLPRAVPDGWIALVARQLRWAQVEVHREGGPALAARLRAPGLPLVPWGHTAATGELTGHPLPPGALRYESKRASHSLFRRLAPGHPGIAVPARWTPAGRREAARLIAARARAGLATVWKSEHGAGGSGTGILTGRVRARSLPRGPLLLEEYIAGDGTHPTYDGIVDARGEVHDVGVAAMEIEGTAYRGATAGPGAVAPERAAHALRFGHAVGRELAASGYRGWYDVDFVTGPDGRLAPTETNLRLTGPAVAFLVKQRLDETRGGDHLVRALDRVPLGARLPDAELMALLHRLTEACAGIDTVLLPSIPTAAYEPDPYIGVVLAAATHHRIDAADALVHTVCRRLGRVFR
ncbi:GNAT family N-acetyltransferase [Streptomyces sp. NPDC001985]|uniref:GNAT family N-acetyltransferase n=1 Tax=Streptomyces sp. NPDC001985 TaxID=3154406 RepID=UPI003331D6BF